MNTASRAEAQQRADEIRVFQQEMERLERAGVLALSDAQRQAVAEHHRGLLAQYAQPFDIEYEQQIVRCRCRTRRCRAAREVSGP